MNVQEEKDIIVVGLGASAGGLEPLKYFFKSLPEKTGMAFIVIVHLSPGHKSNLAELLQFQTSLKVLQINERTRIEPECVYVTPSEKLLSVEDNYIELSEPDHATRHATVDLFFSSLAEAKGERAVAIILSGSGSDGAEGIKSVKEHGGFIIVQDPEDADYSNMPKNAINSGLIDMVLPVNRIAHELLQCRTALLQNSFTGEVDDQEILHRILTRLHDHTGHDFSNYKQSSVLRRIRRRMHVNRAESLSEYLSYLTDYPDEANKLFKDLLISVTRFFRDPDAFKALENEIIPELLKDKEAGSQLRIWIPGCATGEEAYSIAILLHEYTRHLELEKVPEIKIFATDIDEQALKIGRSGKYPESIAVNLTSERLNRYFEKTRHFYHVKKSISGMVLFAHHDLLKDPPFTKLDLIACRNLLIYLNRGLQSEVFKLFHYTLLPDCWLFLGLSDGKVEVNELFKSVNKEYGLYQRSSAPTTLPELTGMPLKVDRNRQSVNRFNEWPSNRKPNFEEIQLNFLLKLYDLQSVIINENYEVIYFTDGIQQYLGYTGGEPSLNILEMIKPELRNALQSLLLQIEKKDSSARLREVLTSKNKEGKKTELQIHHMDETGFPGNYFHIVFREVSPGGVSDDDGDRTEEEERMVHALEKELEYAREQIRMVLEKNKASSGKLKTSNEELQSMNEELHSTAEELDTSLEELHSVNEELKNVNLELDNKVEELGRANSDLKNLMEATEIGILYVDREFCVQLFTSRMSKIFNLLSTDLGRPLEHITHRLRYDSLNDDLKHVLDDLDSIKRIVKSRDNRWYSMRLRPYRSMEEKVKGVVLTFLDITQLKDAEERFIQQKQQESLASLGLYVLERLDIESIMFRAIQQICLILEVDYVLLFMADQEKGTLHLRAHIGWTLKKKQNREFENDKKWDAGYALRAKEIVIVDDYRKEERFETSPLVKHLDIVSGFNLKIIGLDETFGVLSIYSSSKRTFSDHELNYVQIMAHLMGMSFERINARKNLEETNKQLKKEIQKSEQYQREILNTSIAERWEIGGYLHDNLAQVLASAKIMLADINKNLPDGNKEIKEDISSLSQIIDEAMSDIRNLTHDIIPVDIEEEGVAHAFRFLVKHTQKLHKVNCKLKTHEIIDRVKNRKLATNIYHVIQEAIKNAALHGKADNIEIAIMKSDVDVILQIKDDGIGLSNSPKEVKGKGLRIMKHRMELLGGTFNIKEISDSDKTGTIVTCTIPIEDLF